MKYRLLFIVSCLLLVSQTAALCQSSDSLQTGIRHYNSGRYDLARTFLMKEGMARPSSAAAHYYLANTLVKLGQHGLAQEHYQLTSLLDPSGVYGRYSRQALIGYGRVNPGSANVERPASSQPVSLVPAMSPQYQTPLVIMPPAASVQLYSQERSMLYQHGIWTQNDGSGAIDLGLPSHVPPATMAHSSRMNDRHFSIPPTFGNGNYQSSYGNESYRPCPPPRQTVRSR